MTDLINGRTPEEIKAAISCKPKTCRTCPYYEYMREGSCASYVETDIFALVERLESERDAALAKAPRWISVEERLPEENESVIVHYVDGWMPVAFLLGGKWYRSGGETSWLSITHWMSLPEPPEVSE